MIEIDENNKFEVQSLHCWKHLKGATTFDEDFGRVPWEGTRLDKYSISRTGYQKVFDSPTPYPKVLISAEAVAEKIDKNSSKLVFDHCYSPQQQIYFICDNAHIFLKDFKTFQKVFAIMTTQIVVTKKQNDLLRSLTTNLKKDGIIKISCPKIYSYKHLNIELFKRDQDAKWTDAKPVDNLLQVLDGYTEYEKRYWTDEAHEIFESYVN